MRCAAYISVNGGAPHRCTRNTGYEHFDRDTMHECKITDATGKSGLIVRWASWRQVQPAATPEGTRVEYGSMPGVIR